MVNPALAWLAASLVVSSSWLMAQVPADPLAIAQRAYDSGELAAAREAVEKAVTASPNSAAAHLLLAEILELDGDAAADSALERALELGPADAVVVSRAADLYAQRAVAAYASESSYLASDPRGKAEDLYGRWITLEPNAAAPLAKLAALLSAAGERSRAAGLALGAITADTSHARAHDTAWTFLGRELGFEQLAGFYTALATGQRAPFERARCRNYEAQVLKRAGNAEWSYAQAALGNGETSAHISRLEAARGCYERAIAAARASGTLAFEWEYDAALAIADLRACIVKVLGEQRDVPAARRAVELAKPDLEFALKSDPSHPGARLSLEFVADGLLAAYGAAQDPERYRAAFGDLADLWAFGTTWVTDSAAWWNNLGFTAREARRYEQSYDAYEKCIALEPTSVRYLNDTGLILLYHLHRDVAHAEELFRRAVELGDEQYPALRDDVAREAEMRSAYGDALLNLGLVRARTGRPDEAADPLSKLEELDPQRLDLIEARLEQALAASDDRAARAALERLIAASDSDPAETDAMLEIFEDGVRHYEFAAPESFRDSLLTLAQEARARLRASGSR
jgi:tetratricopeptide (TPR) repeat protein